MRPKASCILFPSNGHWASTIRFSLLNRPNRAEGCPPGQSGKVNTGAILHHKLRLDPVGPVVTPVTFTGNYQVEISPLELDFDGYQALRVTAFQDSAFVERLRSDTLSQKWVREKGDNQEREGWELHGRRELIHQHYLCLPERNGS